MEGSLAHIISWIGAALFMGAFAALLVIFVLAVLNTQPGFGWLDVLRMRRGAGRPRWFYDFLARIWGHDVRRPEEVLTERGLRYWGWIRAAEMIAVLGVIVIIFGDAIGS